MKKIIFLFAAFALIGCSSNPKKEEVVTTTETSKVEESTQVAEASLEDELEVEEEIEIVEVNEFEGGENRTEIISQASSTENIATPVRTYANAYPEVFANEYMVQPATQIQEVHVVNKVGCGQTSYVSYAQPACNKKVIYDDQVVLTQTASKVETIQPQISSANLSNDEFLAGFYQFPNRGADVPVYASPSASSAIIHSIEPGKVLWVENHQGQWAKVFRRSGPAYILKSSLNQ